MAVYLTAWSRLRHEKLTVNEITKRERNEGRKGMEGKVEKRSGKEKGRK
jgi:hypothetical protein